MILIDYSNYLDQQAQYAESLSRMAVHAKSHDDSRRAEQLGDAAGEAYSRLWRMNEHQVAVR